MAVRDAEGASMPITESHVRGETDTPLIEQTIGNYFDEATDSSRPPRPG